MAWEWELRATRQASVRYIDGGDSLLSWSAADGAPTGAADLGEGVGEFWADTDGSGVAVDGLVYFFGAAR